MQESVWYGWMMEIPFGWSLYTMIHSFLSEDAGGKKTIQKNYWRREKEIEVAKTQSMNLESNI